MRAPPVFVNFNEGATPAEVSVWALPSVMLEQEGTSSKLRNFLIKEFSNSTRIL